MDLLGSILNAMDKPPVISEQQLKIRRKQKEELEKRKAAEQAALKKFRKSIEDKMAEFLKDHTLTKHEFDPMNTVYRSIIQDVADVAGVAVFSVGEEDIDRRILMYKKEFVPCEQEIQAIKRGEEWDPQRAKMEVCWYKYWDQGLSVENLGTTKEERALLEAEDEARRRKTEKLKPSHNYKDKYSHLIGTSAAKEAAKRTETNKQYGFVPSENKKDVRSIEQTLADIQSKKRLKKSHPEPSS